MDLFFIEALEKPTSQELLNGVARMHEVDQRCSLKWYDHLYFGYSHPLPLSFRQRKEAKIKKLDSWQQRILWKSAPPAFL
jgi:hypothetical protein